MPEIFVDADACPVKDEIVRVAERHQWQVCLVSNSGMRPSGHPLVRQKVVAQGADAADDWIAENIGEDDICITADIPLASRCLERQAQVLHPNGKPFTQESIGMALAMRELMQHLRETGESKGYNASFSREDRSRFLRSLEDTIQMLLRDAPK